MNETNHKRVIAKFAEKVNISKVDIDVLEAASDFTDSINAEWKYYYYHFYYDINIAGNFIQLKRVDENTNKSADSINNCGDRGVLSHPLDEFAHFLSSKLAEKEFFSTIINGRPRSPQLNLFDTGNQSDNVAFLHAMGTEGEGPILSRKIFEEHLKKCFHEYLFIDNPKRALFVLGIALHGIMDSFTPSHMDFQHYTQQDMGLHAQGDVVPFRGDTVEFNPGQISEEKSAGAIVLAATKKGYNGNDHINDKEFEMFKIFAEIGAIKDKKIIDDILNNNIDLSKTISKYNPKLDKMVEIVEPRSLEKLNDILKARENDIAYNEEAFVYSDAAIDTCKEVYLYLTKKKSEINSNYEKYKEYKRSNQDIDKAVEIWQKKYDEIEPIRKKHVDLNLYSKKNK